MSFAVASPPNRFGSLNWRLDVSGLSVYILLSLRFKPLLRSRSCEATFQQAVFAAAPAQAGVPVPHVCGTFLKARVHISKMSVSHFFDAFGQTHNYFTSRATWVMQEFD
jgi:hypothetical protein